MIDSVSTVDSRTAMPENYRGGETFALARVKDYIWDKDLLKIYFDTRNGMIGSDYSTKFSPWLAHGNVSPRYIAQECRWYEKMRVESKSTYWVVFELLWRDYFKFFAKKQGDRIFHRADTIEENMQDSVEKQTEEATNPATEDESEPISSPEADESTKSEKHVSFEKNHAPPPTLQKKEKELSRGKRSKNKRSQGKVR